MTKTIDDSVRLGQLKQNSLISLFLCDYMKIDPRVDPEKFKHCGEMSDALRKYLDESVAENICPECEEPVIGKKCTSNCCQKVRDD